MIAKFCEKVESNTGTIYVSKWTNTKTEVFFVFLKKFVGHMSIFGATDIPSLITPGNISSGFQSPSWQPYLHLAEAYMIYTGKGVAPEVNLIAAARFSHMCVSAEVGCQTWT